MWIKKFGKEHKSLRKTAISQLQSIMRSYNSKGKFIKDKF